MRSSDGVAGGAAVGDELTALLTRLAELADAPSDPAPDGGTALVDQIALLERARGAVAAAQHTAMVAFARAQVEVQAAQVAAGRLDPRALGRGIGDQIGLAARLSPFTAARRLGVARALAADLPWTRAALADGRISEQLAEHVVAMTSHLTPAQRQSVDAQLAEAGLEEQGRRAAEATVKKIAYDTDRVGFLTRGRTARKDRRVTLRPAPDTMSTLSGSLPVEQGVACLAALRKHADSLIATGQADGRTRDQIVADTLVERVTGQARAEDVNIELHIVLPLDVLTDPDNNAPCGSHPDDSCRTGNATGTSRADDTSTADASENADGATAEDTTCEDPADDATAAPAEPETADPPAPTSGATGELLGHGPLPLGILRDILAGSAGKKWWRRLFAHPEHGTLVGGDPRRRLFDGFLATLVDLRDHGRCREPYCEAPIRERDHVAPARDGGPTHLANARGTCVQTNQTKEMPGWYHRVLHDGTGCEPHTVQTTTPTGHTYTSRARSHTRTNHRGRRRARTDADPTRPA